MICLFNGVFGAIKFSDGFECPDKKVLIVQPNVFSTAKQNV